MVFSLACITTETSARGRIDNFIALSAAVVRETAPAATRQVSRRKSEAKRTKFSGLDASEFPNLLLAHCK